MKQGVSASKNGIPIL